MKGNFQNIISSEKPVLVDFFADWCQPCKIQSPVVKDVADIYKNKLRVIKIDVDKNPEVSAKYQIQSIPTLILFENGRVQWRQAGVISTNGLKQVLEKFIKE